MSTDCLPSVPVHPKEDLLEEYSFGRVGEPALAALEEHLIMCFECQTRLLVIDEYRGVLKSGIAAFERERQSSLIESRRLVFRGFPKRMLLAAAVLLMFAGAVAWRVYRPDAEGSEATTVRLIALRGSGGDSFAHARVGRPLGLLIDRTDLPSASLYRLEIVTSSGRRVWSGNTRVTGPDIYADVHSRFESGVYWVRVYSGEQVLREFGLHID